MYDHGIVRPCSHVVFAADACSFSAATRASHQHYCSRNSGSLPLLPAVPPSRNPMMAHHIIVYMHLQARSRGVVSYYFRLDHFRFIVCFARSNDSLRYPWQDEPRSFFMEKVIQNKGRCTAIPVGCSRRYARCLRNFGRRMSTAE